MQNIALGEPSLSDYLNAAENAATALGVNLVKAEVSTPDDLSPAFGDLVDAGANVIVFDAQAIFSSEREQLIALAANAKIPAIYSQVVFVEDGGLMSYGFDLAGNFRRLADYVVRIFEGATPADLPVGTPSLQLAVNLITARDQGLEVPPNIIALAGVVIE